jgi:hypothetical protein
MLETTWFAHGSRVLAVCSVRGLLVLPCHVTLQFGPSMVVTFEPHTAAKRRDGLSSAGMSAGLAWPFYDGHLCCGHASWQWMLPTRHSRHADVSSSLAQEVRSACRRRRMCAIFLLSACAPSCTSFTHPSYWCTKHRWDVIVCSAVTASTTRNQLHSPAHHPPPNALIGGCDGNNSVVTNNTHHQPPRTHIKFWQCLARRALEPLGESCSDAVHICTAGSPHPQRQEPKGPSRPHGPHPCVLMSLPKKCTQQRTL